ncbi:MAG TPA: ATP-binding protein [Polyangiaceae bacterium]|nr:ATP-binding protein [Polyangiaceae bacterium]
MQGELHALWKVLEDIPLGAYLFRAAEGDFFLEAVNAAARQRSPGLLSMLGRPCSVLYRDQPQTMEAAQRCMRERRTVVQRTPLRRYDQVEATQWHELVYVCVEPDRLIIFSRESSGAEELAAALQESEARYRSVVASLPDAVLLRGSNERVLTCNDAAAQLFGHRARGDLLGKVEVLAEGYRVETEAGQPLQPEQYPSRRVLRTGEPIAEELYQLWRPDGTRAFVLVSAQPVFMRSGAVGASVALFRDVTERRRLEEELRQAQRLESIGRLAGGLAHDFNNLLTAMLGSLELLGDVCPPSGAEDLATLRHGAERAKELTAQLLAFARKQPVSLEVVDVGTLVLKVERLLQRLVGPGVELAISAEPGARVRADAAQLEQVLVNLVVNARDAMPGGGRLEVRVATDSRSSSCQLEVEDRGVGIAPDALRHVFEPFFSTKVNGTGLGLASSYGVIKQHGGEIHVQSQVGHGTLVRVSLPCVPDPPSARSGDAPLTAAQGCVLLVDDDESVRSTTSRLLQSMGYRVLIASDGAGALALARTHAGPIDVLVCDVAMPGRSGPEVAREVLAVRPETRVLFISGYPQGAESEIARHAFLQKPYTRASLAEKLGALRAGRGSPN